MIKNCFLLLALTFAVRTVHAQAMEDVIYLKNQNIIRGSIIQKTESFYKIQTADGSIYNYPAGEVEKVGREKLYHTMLAKKSGYANYTEVGALVAGKTTLQGVTTAAFSFQTINGYQFNRHAMIGVGVGADLYATQTVVPLFGSFRGDFTEKGSAIPFYFVDAGYGINITEKSSNADNFKGGFLWAAGIGVKIPFNKTAGFLLSLGYRYQKTTYDINSIPTDVDYKRLAIRAGFFL